MKPDVIILGGGPNGLAAALSLGGHRLLRPLRVLLLDGRDSATSPEDSRGTALTLASQTMLKVLGVWPFLAHHLCDMRDIIVTDGQGRHDGLPTLLKFVTDDHAQAAAAMVENGHLHRALLSAVSQSPNITLRGNFTFSHYNQTVGHIVLHSTTGETFKAPLLIAADGRNSLVRQQSGIDLTVHDYKQSALSFSVRHQLPHHNTAEEHFADDGVFAFLPLPHNCASIVWGASPDRAKALMALDDEAFTRVLQEQMGQRVGFVTLKSKRACYPLIMQIANDIVAPRIVLLGDAAHAIHPLAGLGLNLGFKDAAALVDCVSQALARGGDIGGQQVLEMYQSQRRFDTVMTTLAMDGMNGLFNNNDPMLRTVRTVGLRAVDRFPSLKSFFTEQAAGQSQNTARLLQGLLPG